MYLQSYYWYKRDLWKDSFPPTLEHIFKDTLTTLRPKMKLCRSYEETRTEINNIRITLGVGKIFCIFVSKITINICIAYLNQHYYYLLSINYIR